MEKSRKLALKKETLRVLTAAHLQGVRTGTIPPDESAYYCSYPELSGDVICTTIATKEDGRSQECV